MFPLKESLLVSRDLDIDSLNEEKRCIIQAIESLLRQKFPLCRKFMAGGCAAFLLNRTSSYTDIDIYIEKNENIEEWAKDNCQANRISIYVYQSKWPCCYLNFEGFLFNLIFIEPRPQISLEARILRILKSFDLTICKVAMYFSSGVNPVLVEWKLTDVNFDNVEKKDRITKYKKRIAKKEVRFEPNNLAMSAYTVVVDHDDSCVAANNLKNIK